ncbi:MAG: ribosome-associated translation inhibitor RaiA [Gemmatimonadota bacterium]
MRVQVAARHCQIPDSTRTRAEYLVGRLTKYEPGIASADVVFEEEKLQKRVEAILSIARSEPVIATGEGQDFRTALDKAVDRLIRILKRRRSQMTDHKAPPLSEGVSGA